MPSVFAYLMLFGWPIVAIWLYNSMPPAKATILALLGAYLLLPVRLEINPPLLPPMDKSTLPNAGALLGCLLFAGNARKRLMTRWSVVDTLSVCYLLAPFATAAFNDDFVWVGGRLLDPMTPYDAMSASFQNILYSLIPFWLGRAWIVRYSDVKYLLRALVIGGLAYSLLILLEVRLSPQLHTWIYGYFPHEFVQQMRYGGFRPVVFLGHGLTVAFFAMCSATAAAGLWRMRVTLVSQVPAAVIAGWLGLIVVACKGAASVFYTAITMPAIALLNSRGQLRLALLISVFVLAYPASRITSLFPTDTLVQAAGDMDAERAASLQFRFDQERDMIVRVQARPWFGWGSWGRYRTYANGSGQDTSVTDSRWIISFGQFGLFGFLAEFGILLWPVWQLRRLMRRASAVELVPILTVAILVTIAALDSMVNDTLPPIVWMMAGTVVGYSNRAERERRRERRLAQEALLEGSTSNEQKSERPALPHLSSSLIRTDSGAHGHGRGGKK